MPVSSCQSKPDFRSASDGYRRTIQFASEFSELSPPLKA